MPQFEGDGISIFYERVGAGLPFLVMHGGLGWDHTTLHPWLNGLGDGLELVYYDHRGNGRSTWCAPELITLEALCEDADALRKHLGCERVGLIAHSCSCFVALHYARLYPDKISRLILISWAASIGFSNFLERAKRRGATPAQLQAILSARDMTDDDMGRHMHTILPLYFHGSDLRDIDRWNGVRYRADAFRRGVEILQALDLQSEIPGIRAQTLAVCGDDDFATPLDAVRQMCSLIPRATCVVIASAGHMPHIEQPEAFQLAVKDWILGTGSDAISARAL